MGCAISLGGETKDIAGKVEPTFDQSQPLSSGNYKLIFEGSMGKRRVAVCVAKPGIDETHITNEIRAFHKLGNHQNIINLYYGGVMENGLPYLATEIVQPIGYDLERLKNQYQLAGQSLHVPLMARIISQLVDACRYMHSKSLIHRDLKAANVLVNEDYHAKLIDMGTCAPFGTSDARRTPYLAQELCEGVAQGAEVDCWGVGLILHQVY